MVLFGQCDELFALGSNGARRLITGLIGFLRRRYEDVNRLMGMSALLSIKWIINIRTNLE